MKIGESDGHKMRRMNHHRQVFEAYFNSYYVNDDVHDNQENTFNEEPDNILPFFKKVRREIPAKNEIARYLNLAYANPATEYLISQSSRVYI